MITTFRHEVTANGFDFGVMKSGMQKYIRRGEVDKALRCVEEMDRFAEMGQPGERLRTNMIHRLQIIFLEDIGIGNYHLWKYMCQMISDLFEERTKPNRDRTKEISTIKQIVHHLCYSRKIRAANFMNSLCTLTAEDIQILAPCGYADCIPDGLSINIYLSLLDEHMASKSWKSILVLKRCFAECMKCKKHFTLLESLMEKYVSLKWCKLWKKDLLHLAEGYCLYFVPLAYYLYGTEPLQLIEDMDELDGVWPCRGPFEIDDFVLDKHVKSTYVKNGSTSYFATESSKVFPEIDRLPPEMKKIYIWARCGKTRELTNDILLSSGC